MKIVIAPDSFKGSLTSLRAAQVIKKGLSRALPSAKYLLLPVSDGGEGLVEVTLLVAVSTGEEDGNEGESGLSETGVSAQACDLKGCDNYETSEAGYQARSEAMVNCRRQE